MKLQLCLIAVSTLLWGLPLNAQKRYLFHTYTTRDGLPNNTIYAINQDKHGYMWFGTDAGVARFDGYLFNNRAIPAINDNAAFVECIEKDNAGNLLITGFMQGVHAEQPDGTFKQYLFEPIKVGKNGPKTIKTCRDGRIFVGHSNFLNLLINGKFKKIYGTPVIKNVVATLECDRKNNIWFGGFYGLAIIKAGDTTYTPYFLPELKDVFINKILFDKDQNLLVGTNLGYYKVKINNPTSESLLYTVSQPIRTLKDILINHIFIDQHENVWFSTSVQGIYKTRNDSISENISTANGLPSACVYCTFQDNEGNYWIGTNAGACKLSGFDKYSFSYNDKLVDAFDNIVKDPFGRLWLSDGTSLYILLRNHCLKKFDMSRSAISDGGIYKMIISKEGMLLIANHYGLYAIPLVATDTSIKPMKCLADFTKSGVGPFKMMNDDKGGNVWLGFDNGLYVFRNGKLSKCNIQSRDVKNIRPAYIVQDRFGYYWIGDFIYGLYRMSLAELPNGEVEFSDVKIYKSLKPDSAFVNAWIKNVYVDNEGNIWQSSLYTGVYKLRIDRNGVVNTKLYSVKTGLSSNRITCIVQDCHHNFWLGSLGGVDRISFDLHGKESIQHFNSQNGLGTEVYSIFPDHNTVYISYSEGFYAIDLTQFKRLANTPPNVIISNLNILNKPDSLALRMNTPLKLRYNENLLSFEFVSISFSYENGTLYQYMLEGLDESWGSFTNRRYVSYNSLPPGKYTFKVKAKSAEGVLSPNAAIFSFIIKPPFYKTWWFILLAFITIISLAYIAYSYRVNQLLKLERLRTRIATDLHDDIGSTLSSISILSEIMSAQMDNNPKYAEMIAKIGSNARNMLESMDDIIWAVNPANDKFQNLGLRIREYAIPLFESKNIMFNIHLPDQLAMLHIPMEIRRNVYLIAKEAINNLVKYSECSRAEVEFHEQHPHLVMTILDNGKGFNPSASSSRNGLKNMKRRANQISADLEVASEPGKGSKIILKINVH